MLTRGVCRAIPCFFGIALAEDDAAGDETWPAFVLAGEDEDGIAFGDVLATVHRLLRAERKRLRPRIANLGFDREQHAPRLAPLIPFLSMGPGLMAGADDANAITTVKMGDQNNPSAG